NIPKLRNLKEFYIMLNNRKMILMASDTLIYSLVCFMLIPKHTHYQFRELVHAFCAF
uniref:Uncharacterized protein n=1 Tax=Astyanax mexicanus TaxID=7994 RepID=A0A3B1K6J4_ASTMX